MCFPSKVIMSLIRSLYEGRGGLVCQSGCGMHYFIWKKAVISPNTVKKAQSPGSTPPPPSQFSSASATGNAAGAALTGIPCILLSCAHKKTRGKKRMRDKGRKSTVKFNPCCVTVCQIGWCVKRGAQLQYNRGGGHVF